MTAASPRELRAQWETLIAEVLMAHQMTPKGCLCGWFELGHSKAEHRAEQVAVALLDGCIVVPLADGYMIRTGGPLEVIPNASA